MRSSFLSLPALVASVLAAPTTQPTVYLAGDSTMAPGGGGSGTQGWGEYLQYSLSIPVVNSAIAGRSARSYTREGRFDAIVSKVKVGDFVIIEFGHNDGGSVTPTDNGRSDCAGTGTETCATTYDGVAETVLTFPAYIEKAMNSIAAKGAHPIVSSQTPNNPFETGTYLYSAPRFVEYAQLVSNVTKLHYIQHFEQVDAFYETRGATTVNACYPNDHTHTAAECAALVAQAFIRGVVCSDATRLQRHVVNSTASIEGSCI